MRGYKETNLCVTPTARLRNSMAIRPTARRRCVPDGVLRLFLHRRSSDPPSGVKIKLEVFKEESDRQEQYTSARGYKREGQWLFSLLRSFPFLSLSLFFAEITACSVLDTFGPEFMVRRYKEQMQSSTSILF